MGNTRVHRIEARRLTAGWFFTVLLAFSATADVLCARPLDEVKASNLLRVVAYDDNKPFSWTDGGVAKGIDVDLGRALARKLGVEAEIILRMQGEKVDDDLRANVWRGPLTGGAVGDVMLHVPIDKELTIRNKEAVIGNPYFEERVAIAIDPARTGDSPSFDVFRRERITVQLGTVADYFLMFAEGGALRQNIDHYVRPADGLRSFIDGKVAAIMGVRSSLEGMLHEAGRTAPFAEPAMPGIVRARWTVGMAVKENSRDLHYAIGNAIAELQQAGDMARIFRAYGVTYQVPPLN